MIPVRRRNGSPEPALSSLVVSGLERIESGLTPLVTSLPLDQSDRVDAVALDRDGEPALVLVPDQESGLLERAARALLAWRRGAPLLERLFPEFRCDPERAPRLIVIGRRFSERTVDLLRMLPARELLVAECVVIDGAGSFQWLVTGTESHGVAPTAARLRGSIDSIEESRELDVPISAEVSRVRPEEVDDDHVEPGAERFDRLKRALLKLSPDVIEEQDGDLVCFRVGDHLLASVYRRDDEVRVRVGNAENSEVVIDGDEGLQKAMDAVFARYFALASTRRRLAEAAGRARKQRNNPIVPAEESRNGEIRSAARGRAPRNGKTRGADDGRR